VSEAVFEVATSRRSHAGRFTLFAWRHPEVWALALSTAAWIWMMAPRPHHHAGMAQWLLMTVAMMLPMVIRPIRVAVRRSLWERRHRAMAEFLAGYIGCWLAVGAAVIVAATRLPDWRWSAPAAFAIAGVWQLTRTKRLALTGCHLTAPLAPRGWRADRDCVTYGFAVGTRCVVSCWALMLACFATGHAMPAMLTATAICAVERYAARPNQHLLSGALFAAAICVLR
jgi:predicted metal-binding membrane protein